MILFEIRERVRSLRRILKRIRLRMSHDDFRFANRKYVRISKQMGMLNRKVCRKLKLPESI